MSERSAIPEGHADTVDEDRPLSPRWRYGVLFIVIAGFLILGAVSLYVYKVAPPIPREVLDSTGTTLFSGDDIRAGQQVFQKYALMDNGTIWGHGAYLGPDFTAEHLHQVALETAAVLARNSHGRAPNELPDVERDMLRGETHALLTKNRFNPKDETLTFTPAEAAAFHAQIGRWTAYFATPQSSRGLPPKAIQDPEELRVFTAFVAWTAWASTAAVPGKGYSYTGNFPYDPAVGNGPSSGAILWSALSLISLLAGTALALLAFGRFHYLGWHGREEHVHPHLLPGDATDDQRAALKYLVVAAVLFLAQVLVGGATAHYRADPGSFYGIDLAAILPSNIARTWHLQLAIFWIATAYVGGGLFLASALGRETERRHAMGINILFGALVVVVVGSLIGEFLGARQLLGKAWFWLGHQGWEYLELGRAWQWLLAAGFVLWTVLLVRMVGPARRDPRQRELVLLFLGAAFTIPAFYLPAFFFGQASHFTVVDTWRFWIIHLWVEGFFELFATVMVATIFFKMGMVSRRTAARVIYLDAILFLGSGIIGTGHHWYWTGQTSVSMALSATFSAMEVVPLILLTLDAWDFVRVTRQECAICGKRIDFGHRWTFNFLIAVGVWNFIGAGVFGLLINLPIVSYYEAGTNLTPNHGHAALMGVFGMLAVALIVFALRQVSTDELWERVQKYVRVSFWGLNLGLAGMIILSLFPTGVLQFRDVIENGYWHARSAAFLDQPLIRSLEWARLPADAVFIGFGVVPLVIASLLVWKRTAKRKGAS